MPNALTGDYEAVLEVSVRQINGLLATLHQNGATGDVSPSFMHSAIMRVGDAPPAFSPGIQPFSNWLASDQSTLRLAATADGQWTAEFDKAPPGVVGLLEESFVKWKDIYRDVVAPDIVAGVAHVQLSTPIIRFEPRSSRVIANVYVRAHYFPDPGSGALPRPVHGRVQVIYEIQLNRQTNELNIPVPADDSAIQFFPERKDPANPSSPSTLTSAEDEKITVQIRKALRKSFKPMSVPLPDGFKYFEFTALGAAPDQTLAIPVRLSSGAPSPGGLHSITNDFRGTSEFAIGVSRDIVAAQFQPTLNNLRQFKRSFVIPIDFWPDPTYHFSVTSADIQFQNNFIDLVIKGKATTRALFFPNYDNIVITQRMTLTLVGQDVLLQASDADLSITGLHSAAVGTAKGAVSAERNKQLPQANAALAASFSGARANLNSGLFRFDDSASASYTSVEINPDGIIVRGSIATKWHYAPVLEIGEVSALGEEVKDGSGKSFTARRCWVPGGRIASFYWTWVENPVLYTNSGQPWTIPWFGSVANSGDQPHEFIFPKPASLSGVPLWAVLDHICLEITGTQVSWDGVEQPVITGRTCKVTSFEPMLTLPPGIKDILGPVWRPPDVLTPDAFLDESIFAHVSAAAESPPAGGFSSNRLVHFADWRAEQPLAGLSTALSRLRRDTPLAVSLVLPVGSLHATRGDVEKRMGLRAREVRAVQAMQDDRTPVPFLVTEDYEGNWTRTFGVGRFPATFIVNARGECAWKHEGSVDPERLAAALHEHLLPGPSPRPRMIQLSVRPGKRAPDLAVTDDCGRRVDLRRLRGKKVLLNFFRSWTEPCGRELRRLQAIQDRAGRDAPFILALSGDADSGTLAEVRRRHELSFALAHDADRRIARMLHVSCWPTTVSINPDGIVDHVQFGVPPAPRVKAESKSV